MRSLIPIVLLLASSLLAGAQPAVPKLEVLRWDSGELKTLGEIQLEAGTDLGLTAPGLTVEVDVKAVGQLQEWSVSVKNSGPEIDRLILRVVYPVLVPGGNFWDGFETHAKVSTEVFPDPKATRYRFPVASYIQNDEATIVGFSPQTLTSRFERSLELDGGHLSLRWDAYLALHPGQTDQQSFVTGTLSDSRDYTEVVEAYYLAYPKWFHPIEGADERIYGEGGYFLSSNGTRDLQAEEARRLHFDWEWYYAPFQRAGAIMPDEATWLPDLGYDVEAALFKYTEMDGLEGWTKYHTGRIKAANRTSAVFYYYLQQYSDADLLKTMFTDSFWINADGKPSPRTFGWIKPGLWIQPAWPGETLYGRRLRRDLSKIWEAFDVAGFSLDCVIGDMRYFGPALRKESGKAFNDEGQVFVEEGVAIAKNIEYTHELPARSDGRRAASIANAPVTHVTTFHADSVMHEMPPYDRADLLPLRRLLAGQKPTIYWKGWRPDSLLAWESVSTEQLLEGLQGMSDYMILSSLRFGGMPAIFFVKGFPEIRDWVPRLMEIQRSGWRAATYVRLPERFQPPDADPYGTEAKLWISRYGNQSESWIIASSPKAERLFVPLEIETSRFGAGGSIYLDEQTNQSTNRISTKSTSVEVVLENHNPAVLRKIAEIRSPGEVSVAVSREFEPSRGGEFIVQCPNGWPVQTEIRFEGEKDWIPCQPGELEIRREIPPLYHLSPESNWVDHIQLGNDKQATAAILVLSEDRAALESTLLQFSHYWEYFRMRQLDGGNKLSVLQTKRLPDLVLPVVGSLDAESLKSADTIFLVGDGARKLASGMLAGSSEEPETLIFNQVNDQDWITVRPGRRDEARLWGDVLSLLDQRFPYSGVLEASPVFNHHSLAGRPFPGVETKSEDENQP